MTLLINDFTYNTKQKRICNVAYIDVLNKAIISKIFLSIA